MTSPAPLSALAATAQEAKGLRVLGPLAGPAEGGRGRGRVWARVGSGGVVPLVEVEPPTRKPLGRGPQHAGRLPLAWQELRAQVAWGPQAGQAGPGDGKGPRVSGEGPCVTGVQWGHWLVEGTPAGPGPSLTEFPGWGPCPGVSL